MRQPESDLVVISPGRITRWLLAAIGVIVSAAVAGQTSRFFLGHDYVFGLVPLTHLDGEASIPSWYSSSALLLCAIVLAMVASVKRSREDPDARYWVGLAVLFTYLSLDEGAGIHELWDEGLKRHMAPAGLLSFP